MQSFKTLICQRNLTLGLSADDLFFLSSSFSFFVFFVLFSLAPLTVVTDSVDTESTEFFLARAAKLFIFYCISIF